MLYKIVSICILLFTLPPTKSLCQEIPSYPMKYRHECSLEHSGLLLASPPYSWSMPLQVFQTYFAIDSICRNPTIPRDIWSLRSVMKTYLSTLVNIDSLFKYLYITTEYNSLDFYKYLYQGYYLNSNYEISVHRLFDAFSTIVDDQECNQRNAFLAMAAGIYRIRITDIKYDSVFYSSCATCYNYITCITCNVIDIIKGESLVHTTRLPGSDETNTWLRFSYVDQWLTDRRMKYGDDIIRTLDEIIATAVDSSGNVISTTIIEYPGEYGSAHHPSVGDEYLIFLKLYLEDHCDSFGTPYSLFPLWGYQPEGAMFKITSGYLTDSKIFFGYGDYLPIDTFINNLRDYIIENFYTTNR